MFLLPSQKELHERARATLRCTILGEARERRPASYSSRARLRLDEPRAPRHQLAPDAVREHGAQLQLRQQLVPERRIRLQVDPRAEQILLQFDVAPRTPLLGRLERRRVRLGGDCGRRRHAGRRIRADGGELAGACSAALRVRWASARSQRVWQLTARAGVTGAQVKGKCFEWNEWNKCGTCNKCNRYPTRNKCKHVSPA